MDPYLRNRNRSCGYKLQLGAAGAKKSACLCGVVVRKAHIALNSQREKTATRNGNVTKRK